MARGARTVSSPRARLRAAAAALRHLERFQRADRAQRRGLDLYLRDARGGRGLQPFCEPPRARAARRRCASKAPSTTSARHCCICRAACRSPPTRVYTDAVIDAALPLMRGRGRRRVPALHQSPRAARAAAQLERLLPPRAAAAGAGHARRASSCCAGFAPAASAVLLGSASFWEGVDVQGSALRLVIIDQAAVRLARGSGGARAHRAPASAGRQPIQATISCPRRCWRSSRASAG